ncbi:hypothetical protein QYE76_001924 [Lolium multiflorum]|uniref:Protein kinase domain-containing protein n=1 Tax=Lolium multiflorum TaxID=4521 RepID=A0AAD8RM96_LOLMU|nr:hypothetical protein QYE76_001924 [Lolium multiflorum]
MVKQSYDPSDNHVGLDIGTVVSNKTANLADFNITIATDDTVSATNYTVWIEYDGVARHIWVYMDVRGKQKPASPVLDAPLDLSKHVPGQSYVGFSGSTGATVGLNSILDWTLTVETFPEKKNGELIFWIFYAVFWLLMIIFMATQCTKCIRQLQEEEVRHERRQEWLRHTLSNLPGMPTEFQYEELEKATEKFNEEQSQSQRWTGGYAPGTVVYKGLLSTKDGWSEAMDVAVKSYNFGRLDEEFHYFGNEIKTNNLLRHQNIVPIIGWCYKYVPRGTWTSLYQVFKYEHLSNGSLEQHLFRRDAHEERPALSWRARYGIVTDVALALHYMHHEHSSLVLHRDIKPTNVMLDAFFRARLSEFGMARVVEPNRSSFADGAVAGTRGYIAPEYSAGREATRRTDVFAFGTLMLEVVTGRHALLNDDPACPLLSDWVWRLHGRSTLLGAVEQSLGIAEFDEYEARRLLLLGMACSSPNPCARPTMPQVLQILSKSAPPPEVPLLKPTFMWPPEEDTTNDTFDESFRILAPANNSPDFFPLLSSGR